MVRYYLQEISELMESFEEVVSPDISVLVCGLFTINLYLASPFYHNSPPPPPPSLVLKTNTTFSEGEAEKVTQIDVPI